MYRKKEMVLGALLLVIILGGIFFLRHKTNKIPAFLEDKPLEISEPIQLKVEGEIDRIVELTFAKPISYGVLFMRLNLIINEYSDISSFQMDEMIYTSINITIPTKDIHNNFSPNEKIDIHQASLSELTKLPQIGEKRAQKIIDYISQNGKISSWEIFFKIASIPEHAKDQIKKQAFL